MKLSTLLESEERTFGQVYPEMQKSDYGQWHAANRPGEITCSGGKLTSLEGAPKIASADFFCHQNFLTSLKGGPEKVLGDFHADHNKLISLEGVPARIQGDLVLHSNNISSLEGGPTYVGGSVYLGNNKLESLKGIHKHIKHIGSLLYMENNPIKSHVLGLLRIEGLREVLFPSDPRYKAAEKIINKYLKGDRDIFACQEELMNAHYGEFAQL